MPIHLLPPWWRPFCSLEALPQGLDQRLEAAHGLDQLLLFVAEMLLEQSLEPFGRNFGGEALPDRLETGKHVPEHAIELVEVALVLHQGGARQIVEALDLALGQIVRHRFHQGEIFAQRHRYAGRSQFLEEGDKHQSLPPWRASLRLEFCGRKPVESSHRPHPDASAVRPSFHCCMPRRALRLGCRRYRRRQSGRRKQLLGSRHGILCLQ